MEEIAIREASTADIPIILGLLYELGRPKPQTDSDVDTFRNMIKNYIKESDKKLLVAVLGDVRVVGMISMVFLPRLNRNSLELYVPELIVLEKYQNHGIGKKLINSCVSLAKEKKCHRIRLESGKQRQESHKFYKYLGFEQDALSFTKNL